MAIYDTPHKPFFCVICDDHIVQGPWHKNDRQKSIPPICFYCEKAWGRGCLGAYNYSKDNRQIRQIWAIASFLEFMARKKAKGRSYA